MFNLCKLSFHFVAMMLKFTFIIFDSSVLGTLSVLVIINKFIHSPSNIQNNIRWIINYITL